MIFTPESLAERWQCSARHVRNMIARGELPAFQLGGKLLRVREDVVEAFERQSDDLFGTAADECALSGTDKEPAKPKPDTSSKPATERKPRLRPLLSSLERRALLDGR
jgi:excisionase family DNA binding protein